MIVAVYVEIPDASALPVLSLVVGAIGYPIAMAKPIPGTIDEVKEILAEDER